MTSLVLFVLISSMPLFEGQQLVVDNAVESLRAGRNPVVLEGLSGFGKSLIVSHIADTLGRAMAVIHFPKDIWGEAWQRVDVDDKIAVLDIEPSFYDSVPRIVQEIKGRAGAVIVLANVEQGSLDYSQIPPKRRKPELSQTLGVDPLKLPALSEAEVAIFAKELNPDISDADLALVQKFSLGISLLVKRMVQYPQYAETMLGNYITGYFRLYGANANALARRDQIPEILERWTGKKIPIETIERYFEESRNRTLAGQIPRGALTKVEHPFPVCAETVELYERLCREPGDLTIIIPDIELDVFMNDLGVAGWTRSQRGSRRFEHFGLGHGGDGKTFAAYREGDREPRVFGCETTADSRLKNILRKAPAGGNLGVVFSRDHEGILGCQVKAGYATETFLQGIGIRYLVTYEFGDPRDGGERLMLEFDAEKREMVKA